MTEQQEYRVLDTQGNVELREYAPCVVADVVMSGSAEQAGSAAFQPLFQYISGANRGAESLAMTAPVIQAPVIQAPGPSQEHVVAFVLPASVDAESAPIPTDARVSVREMPATLTAVSRYSGRWSQSSYDQQVAALRAALAADGLTPVSQPRFARFDPPFKPWFLRRNEVHIDVAESR